MDVRYTPEMLFAHFVGLKGLAAKDLEVAPTVVLSWNKRLVQSLARTIGAKRSSAWVRQGRWPLYTGEVGGQRVSICHAQVGSPSAVMQMEQLISCGARIFIGVGWAGSLQPSAPIGSFLIPTACVCEEGTSVHYVGADAMVGPSQPLVEILQKSCQAVGVRANVGPHWTIDAPFRETISKIEKYGEQGVLGVDMETSAMYALGQFRGVQVCNLLMVSDELWREWRIAFGSPELEEAARVAKRVILRCLNYLAHPEKITS